jgi:hypothetical protein
LLRGCLSADACGDPDQRRREDGRELVEIGSLVHFSDSLRIA